MNLSIILLTVLSIVLHELGHVAVAKFYKLKIVGFSVTARKISVKILFPGEQNKSISRKVALGGLVTTLILVFVFFFLFYFFNSFVFAVLFILNIILLLTNAIPIKPTDGWQIAKTYKRTKREEKELISS